MPPQESPISQAVLSKCDFLTETHLWPLRAKLDPRGWLSNFTDDELQTAVLLLDGFLYFPADFIDELFIAGFRSLTRYFVGRSEEETVTKWNEFFDNVILTGIGGELPNVSESSNYFLRRAKQKLEIPEDRILSNDEAIIALHEKPGPVVFVDDFLGSGDQFLDTIRRVKSVEGRDYSFQSASRIEGTKLFYIPLVANEYGIGNIDDSDVGAFIRPVHTLSSRYSAFHPNSVFWPADYATKAQQDIRSASQRAGIDTRDPNNWKGFRSQGLALAFEIGIPDANLEIFTWKDNGWKPLIRL